MDERLLSVASDIEVLNAQVERDGTKSLNIQTFWLVFLSNRPSDSIISNNIDYVVLYYLMINMLPTYDNVFSVTNYICVAQYQL